MASKYSKSFYIPRAAQDIDIDYLASLDPVDDAEEIRRVKGILSYQVHGAKIICHQSSEFVLVEVLVHLRNTGFIRDPKTTSLSVGALL